MEFQLFEYELLMRKIRSYILCLYIDIKLVFE
jgi:hypothetical protein